MSKTPIFDALSKSDRDIVNHHVSGQVSRIGQIDSAGDAVSRHRGDIYRLTEKAAGLLNQGGATAQYMRSSHNAAHPTRIADQTDSLSR